MEKKEIKIEDVFIPGGMPTFTYNPREYLKLESQVTDYLKSPYKILSITGPTKSGKTVLAKKVLDSDKTCWAYGGQLYKIDDLWDTIINKLHVYTSYSTTKEAIFGKEERRQLEAGIKPGGIGVSLRSNHTKIGQKKNGETAVRVVAPNVAALDALERSKSTLVIDDFHCIKSDLQLQIIKYLKGSIFNGLPLILISIPHRAYDAIRINREMTGRVKQVRIPPWADYELQEIIYKGFEALSLRRLSFSDLEKLIQEALSNPHLMQEFCLALCRQNGIMCRQRSIISVKMPHDWNKFYQSFAIDMSKPTFDRLTMEANDFPATQIKFKNGSSGNIYKVLLVALGNAGACEELKFYDILQSLQDVLENQEKLNEPTILDALEKLSNIARFVDVGEPILEWDIQYKTLHIIDPFFAFYLKWGPHAIKGDVGSKTT